MVFPLRITNSLIRLQWAYPCYSALVQRQIKPHLTPLVRSLPLTYKTRLAQEGAGQPTDIWVKVSIWGFETLTLFRTKMTLKVNTPSIQDNTLNFNQAPFRIKDKMHAVLFFKPFIGNSNRANSCCCHQILYLKYKQIVSLGKNLLVLIYSKLHSKSCDYLY